MAPERPGTHVAMAGWADGVGRWGESTIGEERARQDTLSEEDSSPGTEASEAEEVWQRPGVLGGEACGHLPAGGCEQ